MTAASNYAMNSAAGGGLGVLLVTGHRLPRVMASVRRSENHRAMRTTRKSKLADQGAMDDLVTRRVMRHVDRQIDHSSRRRSTPHSKRGCMVCFAKRVEQALQKNHALPKRRKDRS